MKSSLHLTLFTLLAQKCSHGHNQASAFNIGNPHFVHFRIFNRKTKIHESMFSNKNQMYSGIRFGLTYLVACFFKPTVVFLYVSVCSLTSGWCAVVIENTQKSAKASRPKGGLQTLNVN